MNRIPVGTLSAGQRFSDPVYMDRDNLFVPEGVPIKERDIERLRRWGVEFVQSDGVPISGDAGKAFNSFFLRAFSSNSQQAIVKEYGRLREELLQIFGMIRATEALSQDAVNRLTDRVVKLIDGPTNDVVQYMLYGMQGETGDVENALNVALLCALLAPRFNIARHHRNAIVTAALLHDVGMLRVNPDIIKKRGALSKDERRQIQTHPVHSYRIITKELEYTDDVGLPALQHQERWDGTGYPRRLSHDAIGKEARIIAVADSFVAMVSHKPYRTSVIGYTAIRNLLSDNGTRFDPDVLKVFIQVLGIYPIGSIVLLSDGSVCRVVENKSAAPLKPRVKVIIDVDGHEFMDDGGAVIDLAEQPGIFIAKAVDANSLADKHA